MTAMLLSNTELLLGNFLWMWGGPLPAILLFAAALFTHLGDDGSPNGELHGN